VRRCPNCGESLPEGEGFEDLEFCPYCGASLSREPARARRAEVAQEEVKAISKEAEEVRVVEPREVEEVRVVERPRARIVEERPKPTVYELKARERLKALERFLASAARLPTRLSDPGGGKTLATYAVGLARVRIALADDGLTGLYLVDEPQLDPEELLAYAVALEDIYRRAEIPEEAIMLQRRRLEVEAEEEGRRVDLGEILAEHAAKACETIGLKPSAGRLQRLVYYLTRELFAFGVINVMMEDEKVEDISVIGPKIYVSVVQRDFSHLRWLRTNAYFRDDEEINDFMNRLGHAVGHGLTVAKPYADFALQSGDRFAGILGREITAKGPGFTIRKFATRPLSLPYLVKTGMLSPLIAAYLWFALESKALIGIAGPTGSGKTTLFNALLSCIHPNAKITSVEDVYELHLPHRNWMPMTARRSMAIVAKELEIEESELVDMCLRLRPDYIVIGEVRRDDSVYHLLKAAFTGHGGGFTFHAGSAEEFYSRLGIMLQRTGMSEGLLSFLWGCAITSFYDTPKGRVRRVIEVAEIVPDPSEPLGFKAVKIFNWNASNDSFTPDSVDELLERSVKLKELEERFGIAGERVADELMRKVKAIGEGIRKSLDDTFQFHEYLKKRYYAGARV